MYLRAKRSQSAAVSSAARPGMSEVLLKLDAPHANPWPIRYLRMPGGETSAVGSSSPNPCMKSRSRPFQWAGTSIWYTLPPSRP